MLMFWGLVLEPSKRYTQKVQQSFHISQAALELSESDSEPVQLILEYDGFSYVLGTLSKKANIFQVPLDLNFNTGDQISFRTIGRGKVHLTGYHIIEDDLDEIALAEAGDFNEDRIRAALANSVADKGKRKKSAPTKTQKTKKTKLNKAAEPGPSTSASASTSAEASDDDSMEDDVSEEDVAYDDLLGSDEETEELDGDGGSDDEDDEEDDEDGDEIETDDYEVDDEDSDEEEGVSKGKKGNQMSPKTKSSAKENGKTPKSKRPSDAAKPSPKPGKKTLPSPTKGAKTPKSEKKSPKGEKKDHNKPDMCPQKRVVEGGVIVEELKVGEGPVAKPGKMVQVYYVGRLQSSNKQFDATTQGPGFKFRLGKGEVIRGWDIGVNGMKVGGKRKITIPAQLGYGTKGAPPAIPPHSVLIFEVELKAVH